MFCFGCSGSLLLHVDVLELQRVGATLHCSVRLAVVASLDAEHRLQGACAPGAAAHGAS